MKIKKINYLLAILGAVIMLISFLIGLFYWNADLLMVLPSTIAGGILLASGYISLNLKINTVE